MTTRLMHETSIRDRVRQHLPALIDIRHDLHRHPEVMFEEARTSGVVQRELAALGIAHVSGLGGIEPGTGTGVVAHLPATGPGGACVGLRADMDALPIQECTGRAYASTIPGVMHACGHDGHTAILLGVARVLAELPQRPNPVTLVFQPAEEGGAGAEKLCRDSALGGGRLKGVDLGPAVTRMYGLHGWPDMPLGVLGSRPGPLLAATDEFDVVIRGVGGHAAFPHLAADPVMAAAHVVTALQTMVSRGTRPTDACVVTVSAIHGGSAHNVIPDEVSLRGTVRTLRDDTRAWAKARFFELVGSAAATMQCRATISWEDGYPVTHNDPVAYERVARTAEAVVGASAFMSIPEPFMGGEDFSYYGRRVPACFFVLGLCPAGADPAQRPRLHQPEFDFNDDAIGLGVEMMVRLALSPEG